MSEMLERVADGLAERFKSTVAASAGITFEETGVSLPHRDIWLAYAKAALGALRHPTDDMVQAARRSAPYDRDVTETWPLMIDEALK